MGSRKQSTQVCGYQFTKTEKTSKSQSGAVCRGAVFRAVCSIRGAAPGKKTAGLQQKNIEVKMKKTNKRHLEMEMVAALVKQLSLLPRKGLE